MCMDDGKPREVHQIYPFDLNPAFMHFEHGDGSGSGLINPRLHINGKEATMEEVAALIKQKGKLIATHRHHVNFTHE